MNTTEDRYNGLTVDPATLPETVTEFIQELDHLLASIKGKKLLWVKIPIDKSGFVPELTKRDFEFHHCENKTLMLVKELEANSIIPTPRTHTAGVGAVVMDGTKLLVIKNRFSVGYTLPGGHVDANESLKEALKREVYEETGVHVRFESIVNVGHFTKGQFGESNIYIVCTANATSKDITIHDASEIVEAKWMEVDEFLNSESTNNYNKGVVKAAVENKGLKLVEQAIPLKVYGGEVFF